MNAIATPTEVGPPLNRVEGPLKVHGAASYPMDVHLPNAAHAVLVQSTVASGRITAIAVDEAERAPGVLAVITHVNAPRFPPGPMTPLGPSPLPPLQSDEVLYFGQHVALVVAETLEQAQAAAATIALTYERTTPILSMDDERTTAFAHPWIPDQVRGDVAAALASSDVRIDETYGTPDNTHNPIGLFATVAAWDGDRLTVHDTTQWPRGVRETLAQAFGIDPDHVRSLTPYVGGAFGAGLRVWPHVTLAALAARVTHRPVKLVLSRVQMFTSLGHRPTSVQRLSIGATRKGQLTAIEHEAMSAVGIVDEFFNPITPATAESYACPNVAVRSRQVRLNVAPPGWMRAPGHAEGLFALESALDELSYRVGIDPLDLRIRNHSAVHPHSGLPWSSNALLECYRLGAERFGWSARRAQPRSMKDGRTLVGYGTARAALSGYQPACKAGASVYRDGTAFVSSAGTDIGSGTYTVMTMLAAERLGLPVERVRFGLGDSDMPIAPQEGGSGLGGALGNATHDACINVVRAFVDLVTNDSRSPLRGCTMETVTVRDGGMQKGADASCFESYADILARNNVEELTRDGESTPPVSSVLSHAGSFGAHFVEIRVDLDLGTVRVSRVVSVVDGGRILNEKTARSQIIGGVVGGIGMALLEETVTDRAGRLVNTSLGDYLVAVNADVPEIDVSFVGKADPMTPTGTKGIGELALVGVAAAIGNAVYHATGERVRSLPISLDRIMHGAPTSPTQAVE